MNEWRLLPLETHDAFMNMAIDEAIVLARIRNEVPNTLRFYRWKPAAVSIGKFQDLNNEVQLENCEKYGVEVVRRITGGGAVYHSDRDEITYSVVANKQSLNTSDILDVYSRIYKGIAEALELLGVKADFNEGSEKACPNLTIRNRKISGSAQTHKSGVVLQHGTLLLGVDLDRMFQILRVPWATTCMEVVGVAKNRITSISTELGRIVTVEEVHDVLIKGFQTAFRAQLAPQTLTEREQHDAGQLYEHKYPRSEWNFHGKSIYLSTSEVCH